MSGLEGGSDKTHASARTLPFTLIVAAIPLMCAFYFPFFNTDIKNSNKKHRNEGLNRYMQNFMYR